MVIAEACLSLDALLEASVRYLQCRQRENSKKLAIIVWLHGTFSGLDENPGGLSESPI